MLVYNGKKFVPLDKVLERPDILELVETFDLELLHATRYNPPRWKPSFRLIESSSVSERSFISRFVERNHHRTCFENVYEPNYDQTQLSFDW